MRSFVTTKTFFIFMIWEIAGSTGWKLKKEKKQRVFVRGFSWEKEAARRRIAADFQNTFSRFDLLLAPVFSRTAKKIGQQEPLKNYLDDFYTVAVNLAGLPAVSFPAGFDDDGLPIGLQLIGNVFEDEKLLDLVDCFQRYTDYHERSLKGTLSKMGGGENDL